jgi:hypothetical protein
MPADSATIGSKIVVQQEPGGPEVAKGYLVERGPTGELVVAPKLPEAGQAPEPNVMAFAPTPTTVVKKDRGNHAVAGVLIGAGVDVTVTVIVIVLVAVAFSHFSFPLE